MMQKGKWEEIIKDFHESRFPDAVEREINMPVEMPISRAVAIIGPRRAGKTYSVFQLIKALLKTVKMSQVLYVNFERADIGVVDYRDLIAMLETFYEMYPENKAKNVWLFLDEIQNVSGWEKFVRTALDQNVKVYLTGSSSKLLSKEIATAMRGRTITYRVLPFSFREFLRAKNFKLGKFISSSEKAKVLNLLRIYLEYGGYPEAVIYEPERERILNNIIETAVYKDVVERSKIRNTKAMKLLMGALINSKEFSVHKFYNFLRSMGIKVGKNVLYKYIEHLNDAFFVFMLRKFSHSYKEAEQSVPKAYFIDNGLLKISGIHDHGRLMENLVFVELLRKECDISYYRSVTKEEAGFVLKDGKQVRQIIQVCHDIGNFNTKDREVRSIIKASKNLKCRNLLVITWDFESEEKLKGKKIKYIPLWKWLLGL